MKCPYCHDDKCSALEEHLQRGHKFEMSIDWHDDYLDDTTFYLHVDVWEIEKECQEEMIALEKQVIEINTRESNEERERINKLYLLED